MDKTHPEKSRHVHRVDLPGKQLVGWGVRYQRGRKYVARFFTDRAYGGRDEAHAAALRFVSGRRQDGDELLALLRRLSPRKTSRFGLPGVTRLARSPPDRGAFWVAYWNDVHGRKVQRKFSVSVHGEYLARELAIETRRNATKAHRKRLAELLGPAHES
jgi:hypothetical protein